METKNKATIAVLGASQKPERFSNQALALLIEQGFRAIPIHPAFEKILNQPCIPSLDDLTEPVQALTLYVSPKHQKGLAKSILRQKITTVIFNPGTENPSLIEELQNHEVRCITACTLVLLHTDQLEGILQHEN